MDNAGVATKSIYQKKHEAIECVSRKILNKFGYPNDIELVSDTTNNDVRFVLMTDGSVVAKVLCSNFNVEIRLSHHLV